MEKQLFGKVAIIGVGLMGGSLGMALRNRRLAGEVVGVFRDQGKIENALMLGAVDKGTVHLSEAVENAELVVLAAPVGMSIPIIKEILPLLKPGCIITDLGSTKGEITEKVEEFLPADLYFVGGHPMTGSEESGVEAANPYLLENAIYVLTVTKKTNTTALQILKLMVEEIGAQGLVLDPREHDLLVGSVSHLPHLAAVLLVNTLPEIGVDMGKALFLAAGGFRDTTRIAMSSPFMWRDIFLSNREMILEILGVFKEKIQVFEQMLENGDGENLVKEFETARETRLNIPKRVKGLLPGIYDLVVLVGDVPGVIGKMATLFGNTDINIKDIEILKSREEEGGSIRFSFSTLEERDRAVKTLRAEGFQVVVR